MAAPSAPPPKRQRRRGRVAGSDAPPDAKSKGKKPDRDSSSHSATSVETNATTHGLGPLQSSLLLRDPKEDGDQPWYDLLATTTERQAVATTVPPAAVVARYRSYADQLYRRDVQLANHHTSGHSKDDQWMESTMRKGTLKDRIAAMSVVVSTNPLHKLYALDSLLHLTTGVTLGATPGTNVTTTNARVAQLAAQAVEDVFLHTLLPNRKLIPLSKRPLLDYSDVTGSNGAHKSKQNAKTLSPRILLLWRYEEMIQERYDLFLRHYISATLQTDTTTAASKPTPGNHGGNTNTHPEVHKLAALKIAAHLLRSVPEGEDLLLSVLVNKLGDRSPKVCATAAHELRRTLVQHSAMQTIVSREVQQLAHRPHLSRAALYNCICFLNQLQLTRPTLEPATTSGAAPTRSLAASLMTTYFRIFDMVLQESSPTTNAKNTPGVISQSRLISALLQGVNRAHPYLPTADQDLQTHLDALYRVVHAAPPGARTQALLLLFHVAVGTTEALPPTRTKGRGAGKPNRREPTPPTKDESHSATTRRDRFYRALYSTLSDPAMMGGGKHLTMYFNLLYKSIKYDTETSRIIAFAKRMGSMALHCTSPVLAAIVFLLNEVGKEDHHPMLRSCYVEVLYGVDALRVLDPTKREPSGALVSMSDATTNKAHGAKQEKDDDEEKTDEERRAPGWELALTKYHFHPSVQKFAATMGDDSAYSGDPLKDFALGPFLDKFAYRNPKSVERVAGRFKRGESVAERRSGTDSVIQAQFALPVNDPSYLNQSIASNADHEEFFHTFFRERARRDELKGISRHKSSDDDAADEHKRQLDALDREEARDMDQFAKYEDLESKWESDEEEEAFVDSLAQQIIDDAMESNMFALDELEDEDPDMEGWDDMYKGDENKRGNGDDDDNDIDDSDDDDNEGAVLDEDFVDDEEYDSENDDERLGEEDVVESDDETLPNTNRSKRSGDDGDVDAFMDDDSDSSDEGVTAAQLDGDEAFANGDEELDSDDGNEPEELEEDDDLALDRDDDNDELAFVQDEDDSLVELPAGTDTFASAEDYEEMIAKSWSSRKQALRDDEPEPTKPKKRKRKKN